ncbi:MAG: adenine deaminase [Thermodesulfobacteriota bacterium]
MRFEEKALKAVVDRISEIIAVARGEAPADIRLENCRIVNVFSGEIQEDDIVVAGGRIVGFGPLPAREVRNMKGMYAAPGLIDAHVHIESSLTCPAQFVSAVLPRGTTTVIADPHEIANVMGTAGIAYMLDTSADLPANVHFTLSSCVPATTMETSGAVIGPAEIAEWISNDRIPALAEMMNFPGVLFRDPDVLRKIAIATTAGKPIDGHSPGLSGSDLTAYLAAGIRSDHECVSLSEAREKLRQGMFILVREGSGAKNAQTLMPLVGPDTWHRMMWCTDDRNPHDLVREGSIDVLLRMAVSMGVDPITAIRMGTLVPATYFGLHHVGAIAPGRQADMVFFQDLKSFDVQEVYWKGMRVAAGGVLDAAVSLAAPDIPRSTMHIEAEQLDFRLRATDSRIRVIEIVPDQIVTRAGLDEACVQDGLLVSDVRRDLLKLAVIERHGRSGTKAVAFVRGFGLRSGALATSVAHDSHNVIVVGTSDTDMQEAVVAVRDMGGGIVVVNEGRILERLALPIAGLMSTKPVTEIAEYLHRLVQTARSLGCPLNDPFMTLSFLALPVIPELKLTDMGLVDVGRFAIVPLILSQA